MRTHEERMQEIYRRSEEQLLLRKKRNRRILLTAIPVILSIGIMTAWLSFQGGPTESAPEMAPEACTMEETQLATVPETLTQTAYMEATYTDYPGLFVEVLAVEQSEEGTSLKVRWNNETEKEVLYGSSFFIDAFMDDHWEPCEVDETVVFPAIAYSLEPGQKKVETYSVTGVYELKETLTHRFRTECFVYETAEDSLHCELWVTFGAE